MKIASIDNISPTNINSYDSYDNNPPSLSPVSSYSSSSEPSSASSSPPSSPSQSSRTKNGLVIEPDKSSYNHFLASHVVALDCEMVGVGPRGKISVLARVSVVDYYGNSLFDSFVHVEERVTDYRTHVSGVTEQDLKNGVDFGIVRKSVKQLLKNKIIVGHGLENDLRALKIEQDHTWYNIRDSATQYQPYMRLDQFGQWRPYRLRDLTWYHLGIVIQEGGKPHDSIEDARASMALYRHAQQDWDYEIDCRRRTALATFANKRGRF
jgi:RNA exonuclease 4